MVLYDELISLYENHMQILQYVNKDILYKRIKYSEIRAIEHSITLLRGEAMFFTKDSEFCVLYNAVSKELIGELIKIVREKSSGNSKVRSLSGTSGLKPFSFKFNSLLNRINETETGLQVIAYQPESRITYTGSGVLGKLWTLMRSPILLDSMQLSNGRELVILSQSDGLRFRAKPDYNLRYIYIPFEHIDSVETEPSHRYSGIIRMEIKVGDHTFSLLSQDECNSCDVLKKLVA